MPLDASKFYLIRASSGISVMVKRGDGLPTITGGGSNYNTIQRPRRKSIVQWTGDDPYTMDVPIMIDGWATGTYGMTHKNMEADVARINQMRFSPGDLVPPVQVFIDGAVPVKGATWVITGIDWGTAAIWQADAKGAGHRLRQDAILHLLQYVQETDLKINKMPAMTTRYVVKAKETIQMVAAKRGVTVNAIKVANGIRDGKKLPPVIYIPPSLNQGKN